MRVETRRIDGKVALGNAKGAWTQREHVLVALVDEAGLVGQGEAAPIASHCAEFPGEAAQELAALGELELPTEPPADALAWLAESTQRLKKASARFALETALLDWHGHRTHRPAAAILGAKASATRQLCATLDGAPDTWTARLDELVNAGYGTLKLKVSPLSLEPVLQMLQRSKERSIRWRLDANGTLDPVALRALVRQYDPRGVECIEEPTTPPTAVPGLPVALDESMARPGWEALARATNARAVVLKPGAVGGITRTLELAAQARRLGLDVIVSSLWEGPIGQAACQALALTAGSEEVAQGLAPHPHLEAWRPWFLPSLHPPELRTSDAPGLGLAWESVR